MVFYGVALTMVQTAITTMLQEKTDTSMQGRVFGLLGTMYSGIFADWYGYIWPIGGYSSFAVDYDWIGYCAYYNFGCYLF